MDDPLLMGCFERLGDLLGYRESFIEEDWSLFDPIRQRWPFDKFEHQRPGVVSLFNAVNGSDVGVVETGENLCIFEKLRIDSVSFPPNKTDLRLIPLFQSTYELVDSHRVAQKRVYDTFHVFLIVF